MGGDLGNRVTRNRYDFDGDSPVARANSVVIKARVLPRMKLDAADTRLSNFFGDTHPQHASTIHTVPRFRLLGPLRANHRVFSDAKTVDGEVAAKRQFFFFGRL